MVSSGVHFLSPVTVDELLENETQSSDSIKSLRQTGLVVLRVDPAPTRQKPETMPISPPKPNPSDEAIKALKAAEEAVEKLGQDYDRMWLVSLLKEPHTKRRFFGSKPPATPSSTLPLQALGNLAKERGTPITVPNNFDEGAYLENNSDVAAEVGNEGFCSGYEHYILYGHLEGRKRPTAFN